MIRILAAIFLTTIAAVAAPVPGSQEFKLKGWGDPLDPLDDCKFAIKDGRLEFIVPGKGRDLSCQWGKMSAPRVLREKEGDFTITVKVDGTWPLGAKLDLMDRIPFFGAGLFLAADDKNYIRFEKAQYERNGAATCYASLELWQNGEWIKSGTPEDGELKNDKPVHLKLVRKGDAVTGSFSLDGKEWTELKPLDAKLANKVKVGVCAVHTTLSEFGPVFSDLIVE
jgi:regulation of enolase protein 1 (concanavalin A-like superfamily)